MPPLHPRRRDDSQQPLPRKRQRARPAGNAKNLPVELKDAKRGVRLQKAMADAGVAARRDCEDIILQGRVKVNGSIVAAMPAWVDPTTDRIEVDGRPMRRMRSLEQGHEKVYVLLNKPRRVISTTDDPDDRKTVADMVQLPPDLRSRLFPVGRLDADSNGLILMTNDGELANRLTHPRYGVPKQYAVSIRGRLTKEDITALKEGIHLAHLTHDADESPTVKRASMAQVELLGYGTDRNNNERTRILVTLREGQNREIRRMIAHLGFKVRRLERVAIGPLGNKGLGVGQWRFLTSREVAQLQRLVNRHTDGPPDTQDGADSTTVRPGFSTTEELRAIQGPAGGAPAGSGKPRTPRPTRAPRPAARALPNNTEELRARFGHTSTSNPADAGSSRIKRSANAPRPSTKRSGPSTTEELRAKFAPADEDAPSATPSPAPRPTRAPRSTYKPAPAAEGSMDQPRRSSRTPRPTTRPAPAAEGSTDQPRRSSRTPRSIAGKSSLRKPKPDRDAPDKNKGKRRAPKGKDKPSR